jgi:hypothetical protein
VVAGAKVATKLTFAMASAPPFTERERWQFDNDGVIVVEKAISPCVLCAAAVAAHTSP